MSTPAPERRRRQRRRSRVGRCRRCHGTRYLATGPPEPLPTGTGDVGVPIAPCSCTESERRAHAKALLERLRARTNLGETPLDTGPYDLAYLEALCADEGSG